MSYAGRPARVFEVPSVLVGWWTGAAPGGASGGPARDLTVGVYGPKPARAVTSAISPVIAHRTTSAPCAPATSAARAQAASAPRSAYPAAASAARSAAEAARCLATTA